MIVRRWRATAETDKAHLYRDHLERSVLPQLRALPGFLGVTLMQVVSDGEVELVVESRWQSMDAVHAFAGPTPGQAVVEPAARAVLTRYDDFVTHYDVVLEAGQ